MVEERQPQPFNEAAALAELERLADRIQATRRQREQAVAEFDAFVRTFRQPAPELVRLPPSFPPVVPADPRPVMTTAVEPEGAAGMEPAGGAASPAAARAIQPAGGFDAAIPVSAPAGVRIEAVHHRSTGLLERRVAGVRLAHIALAAVALALILAAFFVRSWRAQPSTSVDPSTSGVPTAGAPAPASAPATSPTAGVTPRALNIEIVTLRPVWVRVTVDDRRAVERELPADQRLPFSADRSISIRAGDAGAVRLTVNGRDEGPLGRNGWPATRTLNAPRPTGR